ncbi:MAG: S9 family peptidase, partial [Bacteroidota bacterium]
MQKLIAPLAVLCVLVACQPSQENSTTTSNPAMKVSYPETRTDDVQDDYFGQAVADPYRWLEDDTAEEVEDWVKSQNGVTFDYLSKIPYRESIRERYEELFNYPKVSSPFRAGDYYFFYKNDGLQNQSVIYYQKGLEGEPEVFIDPNALSEDGTVAISLMGFSKDDKYVAFSRQDAGSDWQEIRVMEVATKTELPDVLEWVKFSGASWYNDGFFYSRYPAPEEGKEYSGDNRLHSVYYHKLGNDQSEDELVYQDAENPSIYHFCSITEDEKYLILYKQPGTDGFATYVKDLEAGGDFVELFSGFTNKSTVVKNLDGSLLVRTNIDAPNYRLVKVDLANPAQENWQEIIPENDNLLQAVATGGGKLFPQYLEKATTRIYQMAYDGSGKTEIKLPGFGSASGFYGKEEED